MGATMEKFRDQDVHKIKEHARQRGQKKCNPVIRSSSRSFHGSELCEKLIAIVLRDSL